MSVARYFNPRLRAILLRGEKLPWNLDQHPRNAYIIQCILAAVPWGEPEKIRALRRRAAQLTLLTGVRHVLDHEIPLNHPRVCGLQCIANMRIVTYAVNAHKGGKWCPEQGGLFDDDADSDHNYGAVRYVPTPSRDQRQLQGVHARILSNPGPDLAARRTGALAEVARPTA